MLAANVIIALAYAAGYAFAAIRRGPWLSTIKTWNFTVSVLILAVIIALFTPIANPTRIAVADQMARLKSGAISPDRFDFRYLRWEGGRYGRAALMELAASPDLGTRKMAQDASRLGRYEFASEPVTNRLTVYPRGQKLPPSFVRMDWSKEHDWMPNCGAGQFCDTILVDLNGDGRPEVIVIWNRSAQVFQQAGDSWSLVGTISLPYRCSLDLVSALRDGHFSVRPQQPRWNEIQIGNARLHLDEREPQNQDCPS
jgi:hypothetical protein